MRLACIACVRTESRRPVSLDTTWNPVFAAMLLELEKERVRLGMASFKVA